MLGSRRASAMVSRDHNRPDWPISTNAGSRRTSTSIVFLRTDGSMSLCSASTIDAVTTCSTIRP